MFRNLFRFALIASILAHLFVGLWVVFGYRLPDIKKGQEIEVTVINADELEKAKAQQITEQDSKPINDEVDKNAKFLSQHNQKVVRQMKAQTHGDFQNQSGLKNLDGKNKKDSGKKVAKVKKVFDASKKLLNGVPIMQALKPQFDWDKVGEKESGSRREVASKTDDYLKDIEKGAQTLLSTREFLYYSYYNRIRSQLKQYWEPKIKEKVKKIFAQGRKIANDQDRITKVVIVLDKKGILVNVQVISESGVRDLDEAAIEAFRAAAPFPNPPQGIIDANGLIKIRWDFILEA